MGTDVIHGPISLIFDIELQYGVLTWALNQLILLIDLTH